MHIAASEKLATSLTAQEEWDAEVRAHDAHFAHELLQCPDREWDEVGDLIERPLDASDRPPLALEPSSGGYLTVHMGCLSLSEPEAPATMAPPHRTEPPLAAATGCGATASGGARDAAAPSSSGAVPRPAERQQRQGPSAAGPSGASGSKGKAPAAAAAAAAGASARAPGGGCGGALVLCAICFESHSKGDMVSACLPRAAAGMTSAATACGNTSGASCRPASTR